MHLQSCLSRMWTLNGYWLDKYINLFGIDLYWFLLHTGTPMYNCTPVVWCYIVFGKLSPFNSNELRCEILSQRWNSLNYFTAWPFLLILLYFFCIFRRPNDERATTFSAKRPLLSMFFLFLFFFIQIRKCVYKSNQIQMRGRKAN